MVIVTTVPPQTRMVAVRFLSKAAAKKTPSPQSHIPPSNRRITRFIVVKNRSFPGLKRMRTICMEVITLICRIRGAK